MVITVEERQKVASDLFETCLAILKAKGLDYSGPADCLENFKASSSRLGLSTFQVWSVYFLKHVDSVMNAIKADPYSPRPESEPLEARIADIINYMVILKTLLEDLKQ